MTELEQNLTARLERLERLFSEVHLPPEAIVGADYVAQMFACSVEAVVRGRFGTDKIPRVSNKPVRFKKSDVHRILNTKIKPQKTIAEKVDEAIRNARPVKRRKSIITKPK